MKKLKVAVCQMRVGDDKMANLAVAADMIRKSADLGAELAVLPEVFNAPYQAPLFPAYAETLPGPSTAFLSEAAARHELHLVGGSIIEKENDKLYNTCFIYGPGGDLLGRHRKMHLFDVDITDGISFRESDTLSPGEEITVIKSDSLCFGVMICFDIRFPELARRCVLNGARLLIVPAAFNMVTGPAHWEILMRARAVDNQCYVIAASPARNPASSYQAWGHSLVVDPWGRIIAEGGIGEEIIMAEIDWDTVERVRAELPLLTHRRPDLYKL